MLRYKPVQPVLLPIVIFLELALVPNNISPADQCPIPIRPVPEFIAIPCDPDAKLGED